MRQLLRDARSGVRKTKVATWILSNMQSKKMNTQIKITILIFVLISAGAVWYFQSRSSFPIPSGDTETTLLDSENEESSVETALDTSTKQIMRTPREIFVTDGVKHSIPLSEILSGGPSKDGIPSIDNPEFWTASQADKFLNNDDVGLGLEYKGEARFYPFRILVWHEIVNDTVAGDPLLVTYCPLCLTGIVFESKVGEMGQEFGVSGKLWQSNLLMYNRAVNPDNESLWSQALGEAVLGVSTGEKLKIITSDIVRWGDWKKILPSTKVLSTNTGTSRNYTRDPYGDYYTDLSVSFGASFNDNRLHPKATVVGIEIEGNHKAYHVDALPEGEMRDNFVGKSVVVNKDSAGRVRISTDEKEIPAVWGFWFSWLAVHPHTSLYTAP